MMVCLVMGEREPVIFTESVLYELILFAKYGVCFSVTIDYNTFLFNALPVIMYEFTKIKIKYSFECIDSAFHLYAGRLRM